MSVLRMRTIRTRSGGVSPRFTRRLTDMHGAELLLTRIGCTSEEPLVEAFSDPVIYLLALTWWLVTAGLAFNSYSPTLTASLGIGGSTISLLLTAPPYSESLLTSKGNSCELQSTLSEERSPLTLAVSVYALIVALVNAWHSDRTRDRSLHVVWPLLLAIGGCIIPLATTNKAARFVGIFLMTGAYGGYPIILVSLVVGLPLPIWPLAVRQC